MSATHPSDISIREGVRRGPPRLQAAYARSQLGEVMLQARLRRGMGLLELAARVGVAPARIAKIECGQEALDVVDFFTLAVALDYDPVDLFAEAAWVLPDPQLLEAESNLVQVDWPARKQVGEA